MENTEKIYEFRRLSSEDMFVMFQIISKIGINEFKDSFKDAMSGFVGEKEGKTADQLTTELGITVFLDIGNVVLGNLNKCKADIYQLLAQTSNLKVDEIKKMDAVVFMEMVIDFIKEDEFKDFLRVVSKLFNK